MISTLDFVYIVLGVGLIPFFTLLCMVLWRVYKMMDQVERVIDFTEKTTKFVSNIDRVPGMIASRFMDTVNRFVGR